MFLPGILMFFTFYRTIYVMIIPGRQFNLPGKPVNNKGRLKHCRMQLFRQRHFKAARHLLLQTPILALKISLDGHFPSSYIKIEGKYTACAFNFCHLRPLHSDITGPEFRPRLIILWPTSLTIGWIPRNFKIFILSLNYHFWGKITKMITTDSPYI